jgi:uncharacterized membrane protein
LLPVGWAGDQRVYFINSIEEAGKIEILEKYPEEGMYYIRYPIPWLTASFVDVISMIGPRASWLVTHLVAYICFILLLTLVCIRFLKTRSLNGLSWIIILITITIYLHRPFQDMIPSSIGMLSLVMTLYLFMSHKRLAPILLLLTIPLVITHGLSIYFTTSFLLLIAISSMIASKLKRESQRAINFAIMVFAGSWFYQVGTQLIDSVAREIPYRLNQILDVIKSPWFERPVTSSVAEQELHIVYSFDNIITPLAYIFPSILVTVSAVYFAYKTLRIRNESNTTLAFFSIACLAMFLIAGIFAWKGLENAAARYLYIYAAPISILVNASLLNSTARHSRSSLLKIVISILLLTVGLTILTESFYTPYASILATPDGKKLEKLYGSFYGPGMLNRNLANGVSAYVFEESLKQNVRVYPSYGYVEDRYSIVYANGFVVASYLLPLLRV